MRWLLVALILVGCDKLFGLEHVDRDDASIVGPCEMRDVSVGRRHTCAVDGAGAVWCWGFNEMWQVEPGGTSFVVMPTKLVLGAPATHVAAGRDFTCALLETGTVSCWGSNRNAQLGTGASSIGLSGVVPVALGNDRAVEIGAGAYGACVRIEADSSVKCWGDNAYSEAGMTTNTPSLVPNPIANTAGTKQLDVGHRHHCSIDANDQAACWGRGGTYQLGSPSTGTVAMPRIIAGLGPVTHVAAAGKASCAVEQTGDVRCWGRGNEGQLGLGTFDTLNMPGGVTVSGAVQVELGSTGGCARMTDGHVECWGTIDQGDGTLEVSAAPRRSLVTGATALETNFFTSCAIVNNEVVCWGENVYGQLGRGTRSIATTPVPVSLPVPGVQVSTSETGVCVLGSDGSMRCWGRGDYGELGNGRLGGSYTPVDIDLGFVASGVASGWFRNCAWNATQAKCWGFNTGGLVGNGMSTRDVRTPTAVAGITAVTAIGLGQAHTCALSGSSVRCWGTNNVGQLGNGMTTASLTPVQVTGQTSVVQLAVGRYHSCTRTTSNAVYCWGGNGNGQLGDMTHTNRLTPVLITALSALDIGVGSEHTCARTATNEVHCWGSNEYGQLGLGPAVSERTVPSKVNLPSAATAIAIGGRTSCALMTNGEVYCWGDGLNGQRGDGLATRETMPVLVAQHAGAARLAIGRDGGCSINSGNVACWGRVHTLGNNDLSESTPMAVPLACR